jgi:hypothetical protein
MVLFQNPAFVNLAESIFIEFENKNQRLQGACNRSPGSKLLSITMQMHCGGHLGGRKSTFTVYIN